MTWLSANWPIVIVCAGMVAAAVIDWWKFKVPNRLTFPLIISGWIYSTAAFGFEGLGWSLLGTVIGLRWLSQAATRYVLAAILLAAGIQLLRFS